ncbi:MAG: hypothetical protein V4574_17195 [Pseudomonadota bacterium]
MLAELIATNDELLAALDALETLTAQPEPAEAAVASARLKLSRASGKRRRVVDAACTLLLETASAEDARKLRGLREINATQLEASTGHIGSWGLKHVMADWPGYCRVSAPMRQSLRDLVAADRETLYPLLGG